MRKSRGYTWRRDPGGLRNPFAGVMYALIGILIGSIILGPAGAIAAGWYWQQPAPTGGWPNSHSFTFIGIADNVTGNGTSVISGFDNVDAAKGTFRNLYGNGSGRAQGYTFGAAAWTDNGVFGYLFGNGGVISGYIFGAAGFTDDFRGRILTLGGTGPHRIGPQDYEPSNDSFVNITGTFGNTDFSGPGDNRAFGITTRIYTDNVGGGRSAEGMNVRPSFILPPTGTIATLEGIHIDLMGWGNQAAGQGNGGADNNLYVPTAATIGAVYGLRVLGVQIPPGATTVAAIAIDAGWRAPYATDVYNILSMGATNRNRIDGYLEVYGNTRHSIGNGSGPMGYVGLVVDPTSDNTGTAGVHNFSAMMRIGYHSGSANPAPTHDAFGLIVAPRYNRAASGDHGLVAGAQFRPPLDLGGAATVSRTATVHITEAPTGGTVDNFALWVGGKVRWDDGVAVGSDNTIALGKTGGSGPTIIAQAKWLRVNEGGTYYYIPVWQ